MISREVKQPEENPSYAGITPPSPQATRPVSPRKIIKNALFAIIANKAARASPADSLHRRPVGLYVRPPPQKSGRRGPPRAQTSALLVRRFYIGRSCAARSGRQGTYLLAGCRACAAPSISLQAKKIGSKDSPVVIRQVRRVLDDVPKTRLALRERPMVETGEKVVPP